MENNSTNTTSPTTTKSQAAAYTLNREVIAALQRVINYLWKEELRDVQELLGTEHIVFDLIVLKDWMSELQSRTDGRIP